jgi:outer membrane protein assembly factor BamB
MKQLHLGWISPVLGGLALWGSMGDGMGAGLDWYRWRGPDLNGISKESGWQSQWSGEGPRRVWKASVGTGFSSITVSQGRVFTMGNQANRDSVVCLDAATGRESWRYSYECPTDPHYYEGGTSCTPTVDGDRVYTLSRRGHLICLEAATGKVVWQRQLVRELELTVPEWGFAGSPLVEGEMLIVNVGSAGLAVRKGDGQTVWSSGRESSGYSSAVPLTLGGRRYVALAGFRSIMVLEAATGRLRWEHPWKTQYDINAADPVVMGDRLFISSGYDHGGAVIALGESGVSVVWESKVLRNQFSSAVVIDGNLYGIDGNNGQPCFLKCVNPANGEVRWSQGGGKMGNLMAADGKLIVQWESGEVVVVEANPARYVERGRAQLLGGKCWTQPVLSQGRLYCRNAEGTVVCVDVGTH